MLLAAAGAANIIRLRGVPQKLFKFRSTIVARIFEDRHVFRVTQTGRSCPFREDFLLARGLRQFDIDGDSDVGAHDGGAVVHAELSAIDGGAGGGAKMHVAARIFHGFADAINGQNDLFGDAVEGEISGGFQFAGPSRFDFGGFEGDDGIFRHIEKFVAAQIFIAHFDAGVD